MIIKLKWGIEAIFISNLAATVLSFLLLTPTLLKNLKFSFHKVLFNRLVKFGLPYLPAGLGMMLVQVIDAPILEKLTDVDTVGIYKANYKEKLGRDFAPSAAIEHLRKSEDALLN